MLVVRMLTVGLHVVLSLVAMTPPGTARAEVTLASTYEEAASDPADTGECAPVVDIDLPAPPAILDCNDARTNVLLGDMIGTCDMPRRTGPPLPLPTLHPGSSAPQPRMSDAGHGGDRCPLRPAGRADDSPSLLTARVPLQPTLSASPLLFDDSPLPSRAEDLRLDRPPRV